MCYWKRAGVLYCERVPLQLPGLVVSINHQDRKSALLCVGKSKVFVSDPLAFLLFTWLCSVKI
jgi:hypothetical protein